MALRLDMYLLTLAVLTFVQCTNSTGISLKKLSYRRSAYGKTADDFIVRSEILPSKLACICLCDVEKGAVTSVFSALTGKCTCHSALPEDMTLTDAPGSSLYSSACAATSGYTFDNEAYFCYKVHTTRVLWEEARDVCHSEGGELAKVDTTAKRNIVNRIVAEGKTHRIHCVSNLFLLNGTREYFLGGMDADQDGEWRWLSDNSLVEGFNKEGSSECLEIESDLTFDDTGCRDENQRYFCEILLP
ncbi:uncharacterized protein LOC124140476 [Haliotis rufescens]|uniref:uncharacterized protein LOC124140476 n=1 Tax=Haliotis rufescens TaxID=6454 RepID=UPI00201FABFC|nr:uncharacterized protein LOC124140476 [Haliotis rufescens]